MALNFKLKTEIKLSFRFAICIFYIHTKCNVREEYKVNKYNFIYVGIRVNYLPNKCGLHNTHFIYNFPLFSRIQRYLISLADTQIFNDDLPGAVVLTRIQVEVRFPPRVTIKFIFF